MNSWVSQKKFLQAKLNTAHSWLVAGFCPVILVTKDNWFAKILINTVGLLVGRERFRTEFATTIGPMVMIPKEFSFAKAERVCTHEMGHVWQFFVCGALIPYIGAWVGIIPMTIAYLLLLPVLFNWFRYRLELHAESWKWKWMIKVGYDDEVLPRARWFAKVVASRDYGWPLPERWVTWGFVRKAKKLLAKDARSGTW